jgi:hypothetical protein
MLKLGRPPVGGKVRNLFAASLLSLSATAIAHAQQITGVPGSPSATVTPYGGEINLNASQSKPW